MSPSIRVGLVGAGARGRTLLSQAYRIRNQDFFLCEKGHYGSFPLQEYDLYAERIPDWVEDIRNLNPKITAVFDPAEQSLQRANELCREQGDTPELYETLDAFLDSDAYDAVILTSPNDTHVEIAVSLLERGIDVLCEKPVSNTLEEHDVLIDAAADSSGQCVVGFNLRSSPEFTLYSELIEDGMIGELGMISARNVREPFPTGYRYSRERSGGSLLEKNCHDFDLFNWYTGHDPVRVAAFGGAQVLSENNDITDHSTVIVEYENGVKATLELCLYAPFTHGGHRSYSIRGSDGIAVSPLDSSTVTVYKYDDQVEWSPGEQSRRVGGHDGADFYELKNFFECLQGRAEPPASLLDAKKAAAIVFAADRSIDEGTMVEITHDYNLAI